MYLQETFTFKTRRKVTSLIASLFLLAIISGALTKEIRPCPENCQCYVDPSFLNPLNTAKCDILLWRNKTYSNIQQLKLTRAPGARSCHLPHVSATLFPKLQKLNLSNCFLARIPSTDPNRFHNLDSLDLSHNRIKKIHSNSFDSYPRLSRVIFTNNPLYPQSPSALNSSTLEKLSLDSCHIRDLLPESFSGVPKLRDLSLADNQISEVFADTLPADLATLDLSRNQIVDVPTSELLRLKNLAELILTGNPINCTCDLVRFQEFLSGKGVFFSNGITCKYPLRFAGQNLSHLRADDLCDQQQLSLSSEFRSQIDEDYVNDGGVDEVPKALRNDDLFPARVEGEPLGSNLEGSGDDGDDSQTSANVETAVSNSASLNTLESITVNSVTQFQSELNSTSESSNEAKSVSETSSNPSVDSSVAPIDSVGTSLAASSEASPSTSGTTTPLPQTSLIVASNDSPTDAPSISETPLTENSSTTSSDTSSVAPSAATSETTISNPSPASSEASPEITTPIASPAPSEGSSETTTPTSAPAPSESSPETTTPTHSSASSEGSSETTTPIPSPSSTSDTPSAATSETTTPIPSPAPSESSLETSKPTPSPASSEGSSETTTPISSSSSIAGTPTAATPETTLIPSAASADSTSVSPSNPSSDTAVTEIPEVKPAQTSEKPTVKESSAKVSNSTSIASSSSDAHTGDTKHAGNSSQLYGYVVPGLAVLVTVLVVLALYCGKCASKVDAYKVAETEEEGAELQEISLLPDSNRPSIMKYSSKYPGEKENGQTEKLMSSHDQQNGGSNVGTEVNGNIAEVNGNGSQHSNDTVECCKLVNGQSTANQNDLGDVECTVAKVTTLPDSVPQTAVIRDI